MIYQILANKWRPKDFDQVASQTAVVKVLKNSLDSKKLHHAYLFTGTRGVGKTTIARIFAKSLVCEKGVSSTPCNTCELCVAVNESRCLDVIEIDAASRTKVEDTRAVLDNLAYSPNQARFKIYIIDEVHMLSNHSFNALLKSLEEPPLHVKFLLATTDPQKLPITVLSRCLQFKLKSFQVPSIVQQLAKILTIENKHFETEALVQLATIANGSMRDALSLLEQILAFNENIGSITYANVIKFLHIPNSIQLLALLKAVIGSNTNLSLKIIEDLLLDDCDPSIIVQELQTILKDLVIFQLSPDYFRDNINKDKLLELANLASSEDLQLYYEIITNSFKNLAFVPNLKTGLEMMVLRMIAFKPLKLSNSHQIQPKHLTNDCSDSLPEKLTIEDRQKDLELDFIKIIQQLELSGLAKELARSSVFESIEIGYIKMIIDEEQKLIATDSNIEKIKYAFSKILQQNIKIIIEIKNFSKHLELATQTFNSIHQTKIKDFIAKDDNISELIKGFDGKIEKLEGLVDPI